LKDHLITAMLATSIEQSASSAWKNGGEDLYTLAQENFLDLLDRLL